MTDLYLFLISIMGSILVVVLFELNDFDFEKTMFRHTDES